MTNTATAVEHAPDKESMMEACINVILHHVGDTTTWSIPYFFDLEIKVPTLTLHAVMLLIGAGIMIYLFGFLYRRDSMVPSGITNLLETFVVYIRDEIAINFLGEEDGRRMTPLFCNFFFFILLLNLIGLVPFMASATGNISVTMGLSAMTLGIMIFGTILKNGLGGFASAFIPHGIPWPVLILVVPIEFIGMFIKAMALTIRLFANMMAGHIVIGALIALVVVFGTFGAPAVVLAFGIYFLKIFVCFLQAYIFTLLSAMFIGMMYHPAH
jgi:F-type H+-transporting ATPase subunit a